MHRLPLRRPPADTICIFCQSALRRTFTTAHPLARPSFLERTRQRIWGTDKPPGFDDPYTGRNNPRPSTLAPLGDEDINYEKEEWQRQVDSAREHPEYRPAPTWDGLEVVGGDRDLQTGEKFVNFVGRGRLSSPAAVRVALHRALVEVFLVKARGLSLEEDLPDQPADPRTDGAQLFAGVGLKVAEDGVGAQLTFESEEHVQDVLRHMREGGEEVLEIRRDESAAASLREWAFNREALLQECRAWFPVSLADPEIKFAVQKRLTQLIGAPIPDPLITTANTAGALYTGLMSRFAKPSKLHDEIEVGSAKPLLGLANVVVHEKKQSPIDRERRTGRLKVINRELAKHGLPLMGKRPVKRN